MSIREAHAQGRQPPHILESQDVSTPMSLCHQLTVASVRHGRQQLHVKGIIAKHACT